MTDQTISHSRVLEKLGGGQPAEAGDAFHFVPYFLVRLVPRWPPGPFPRGEEWCQEPFLGHPRFRIVFSR